MRAAARFARSANAAAACLLAHLASATPARAQDPATLACGLEAGPERAVARVIDGDTLRLDDGKVVRLAGILAPRAADAGGDTGAWPPEAEARAALEDLVGGRTVALAFAGRREDRWGHVLAHLFVTAEDGSRAWVQGRLLAAGQARVHPVPEGDACVERLGEREAAARGASRGLWAHAGYAVRPADRPGELARWQGTYQLVRGKVTRVGGTRALVIVELASSESPRGGTGRVRGGADTGRARGESGGVRVVWRRTLDAGLGGNPRALDGATVLVRGWIDVRRGPELELLAKGQLVVEARAEGAGEAARSSPPESERPAEEPPGVERKEER